MPAPPPQLDVLTEVSRWVGAIVYLLLLLVSLALTRRLNGLAKAMLLWMLAETVIGWTVATRGLDEPWLVYVRIFRIVAGGILFFEVGQVVFDRFLYPLADRLRQWWWGHREESGQ